MTPQVSDILKARIIELKLEVNIISRMELNSALRARRAVLDRLIPELERSVSQWHSEL
jgi:hypothetical protein